jgi:uncharacterized protein
VSTALIVFAKAPVPGLVKTRLIPALGAQGAAALAERLLVHTLRQAVAMGADSLELCVSPTTGHPAFAAAESMAPGRIDVTLQGDGDLGERMHRAFTRRLRTHARVLLIGTDAPSLSPAVLSAAAHALEASDAVFVPALDGGYALVGLRRPVPELFQGMTWSTPQVMAQTRIRATQAGLHWVELPPVADIDEQADLVHLPAGWPT